MKTESIEEMETSVPKKWTSKYASEIYIYEKKSNG